MITHPHLLNVALPADKEARGRWKLICLQLHRLQRDIAAKAAR